MSFSNLDFSISYETTENNDQLLDEFYIPLLENSKKYYRVAGFFSSSALTVAARGIEGLIHNDGVMYLLISPKLSRQDYETICCCNKLDQNMDMFSSLSFGDTVNDNIRALAWMLYHNKLKIKIVVDKRGEDSLFHQKIGIASKKRKR